MIMIRNEDAAMGKRIVIALGGNALGKNLPEQMQAVKETSKAIADLIEAGHQVVIAHGNGPQVGMIQNAFAAYRKQEPSADIMPLSMCVAMSQGYIGYDLQNALKEELLNRGLQQGVATVLTQVVVDENDPAFRHPTKPIGAFMAKAEAEKMAREKGWSVVEDAGRVWTEEELRRMGEICNEYGVMVVADEIHHDLIQPGYKHIVYASLGKEFADNCVICTSLSKTFNLAGLCYASIIIPNDEVRAKFQKQMGLQAFMHIERFGPVAHEAAYRHGAEWLEELIQVIKGNYEYVRDFFAQHFPGVVVTELEGTYLVWCDFRCFGMSDADMKVFLTDECMLYLDNGTDFGAAGSGYQRINVACPRKTLADALDRFYQAARKRGMAR